MRLCSGAGCGRAVADDVRYCDECKQATPEGDGIKAHSLADRQRYAELYTGARWQRVRKQAIQRCPMCARCQRAISEIVDHEIPAGVVIIQAQQSGRYPTDRYAGFYFASNLQGLCRPCHFIKTAEDKAHTGPWPDAVTREVTEPKKAWTF